MAIEFVPRRKWDTITARETSFEKANRLIGYEPKVTFEEGLTSTIDWLRSLQPHLADAIV